MKRQYLIPFIGLACASYIFIRSIGEPTAMILPREKSVEAQSVAGRGNVAPSVELAPATEDVMTGNGAGTIPFPELHARARAGDARAMWKLGDLMHRCYLALELARRGVPSDEADACAPGDYTTWRGWHDKALDARDPVALLQDAIVSGDPATLEDAFAVAARSGDPEAQIMLGHYVMTVDNSDPIDGIAWLLIGCPDCDIADPRLGFTECVDAGYCASNMSLPVYIAAEYGEDVAAEAVARAASLRKMYEVQ